MQPTGIGGIGFPGGQSEGTPGGSVLAGGGAVVAGGVVRGCVAVVATVVGGAVDATAGGAVVTTAGGVAAGGVAAGGAAVAGVVAGLVAPGVAARGVVAPGTAPPTVALVFAGGRPPRLRLVGGCSPRRVVVVSRVVATVSADVDDGEVSTMMTGCDCALVPKPSTSIPPSAAKASVPTATVAIMLMLPASAVRRSTLAHRQHHGAT